MEFEDIVSNDDLRKLTKEQLLEYTVKLNTFAYDTLIDANAYMFYSLSKQMKDISRQVAKVEVDITSAEDMDLFDNIIKIADKSDKISENLEKVRGRIKTNQTNHIKEAEEASLEWYAEKKKG